jgi:hypothetical protein
VVGIVVPEMVDVEPALKVKLVTSVAEMELANVSPTVTTSIVVMTVAEDHVELVKREQSAKVPQMPSQDNVTSTVTLTSEWRSENSKQTLWLSPLVGLM